MLKEVAGIIKKSRKGVVLTGAGISAESGVPTFRGQEGLWKKFRAEELATMEAFRTNPQLVWEWYNWRREIIKKVQPNSGHYALCKFETWFDDFTLITQNVDGLHRRAGTDRVLELHGNIMRSKCVECNRYWPDENDIDPENIAVCSHCGGKIRPDVVWFGEMLSPEIIRQAFERTEAADIFFSIGTSAIVHPAASLPVAARQNGAVLVEINPEKTPLSAMADFYIAGKAGEILPLLVDEVGRED
ncbi:MAG: NAD-dependent deacylase [Candidatus Zixiibacteriota bacterium]